jgi:YD repeat-containing protein
MKNSILLLFLLVISILISCQRGKKDDSKVVNNCQISEMTFSQPGLNYSPTKMNTHFVYDQQKRVIRVDLDSIHSLNYTYSAIQIVEEEKYKDVTVIRTIYTLDNQQRIISVISPQYTPTKKIDYTYNAAGYLTAKKTSIGSDINRYTSKFIFTKGNLTRIEKKEILESFSVNFGYGSDVSPANFLPLDVPGFPEEFIQPLKDYYGKSSRNLINKVTNSGWEFTYTYKKDTKGNILEVLGGQPEIVPSVLSEIKYNCD